MASKDANNTLPGNSDFTEHLPVGIIEFDEKFNVTNANKNAFSFGVLKKKNLKGLLGDKFSGSLFNVNTVNLTGSEKDLPAEFILKEVKTPQGLFTISLKIVPVYSGNKFTGGVAIIVDHLYNLEDLRRDDKDRAFSILRGLHDAILFTDESGDLILAKTYSSEIKLKSESGSILKAFESRELNVSIKSALGDLKKGSNIKKIVYDDLKVFKLSANKLKNGDNLFVFTIDYLLEKELNISNEELEELKRFQVISESIVDSVFAFDENGNIVLWNKGAEKIFGYKKSEVFGKFFGKIVPSFDIEYIQSLNDILDKNNIWDSEIKITASGDNTKYISLKLTKIQENNSTVFLGIANDETVRKNFERELRTSEEKYRNIVTSSNEMIALVDLDYKFNYVNPAFSQLTGYSEDWLLNNTVDKIISKTYWDNEANKLSDLFTSQPQSVEIPVLTKNGKKVIALANINPAFDLNGEIEYYSLSMLDITDKKEAEKDFQLIRSVFEASMDGIAVLQKRRIALANESLVRMFGMESINKIMKIDPLDLSSEKDVKRLADTIQKLEKGEEHSQQISFVGKKHGDGEFYVNASLTSYTVGEEKFIVAILRDVTEQKEAEEKLIASEERYRKITDSINDFLWIAERIDGELKTVFYTSAVTKITGFTSEELINRKFLWYRLIHPNDREDVIKNLRIIYNDPAKENGELDYRIVNHLGNIVWVRNKLTITRDENEKIVSIVGLVSDITLSKKAEEGLKKSAEELRTLNESKDRFISIISHDLRTPFSSILGYTDILLADRNLPEEKQVEYISFIQESAKNMLELVNALLDWTRLQTGRIKFEPKRVDAHVLANKCISMLGGNAMQKNINLVSYIDRQMFIHADEGLMLQALNNLVSNAIKFTNPGGSIIISADLTPDGKSVRFSVKDTGVGIKKEDMDKLFRVDAKFTLPGTSGEKGTGLGLSLVKEIIDKHGGTIIVKSKYGKGTEFLFEIPVSSTTILLVDDLLTDRILYRKLIKSIYPEYVIKDSPNGKAALEAIKSISPLLVITEHKLPLMSGYELIKQTQLSDEIKFKPAFIVLARNLNDSIIKQYQELGVEFVFTKPVNLDSFRVALNNSFKRALS